jgi:lysophospholipase L1-like esterase
MRAFLAGVLKSLITTVIFFLVAEAALRGTYTIRNALVRVVPLPYALGDEYGPIPPWLDRLMILVPDDRLIWRTLPKIDRTYLDIFGPVHTADDRVALLRRFAPTVPAEFRGNPTWRIAINADGFRNAEIGRKAADTIRIACVGDSWTFGMPVDQDQTYPARLAEHLAHRTAHAARRYEVINFGVLGYTSFQGLQLLKSRVLDLQPDIVAIGFGMNDSEVAGYRDKDMVATSPPRLGTRMKEAARDLESYKLLDYIALRVKFHPRAMGEYLIEDSNDKGSGAVDYTTIEPWTRVAPADYERNMREMIEMSRSHGARVVLLDNELWDESPYHPVLQKLSAELNIPFIDSLAIVKAAKEETARDLERDLNLAPAAHAPPALPAPPAQLTTVVFRAFRGSTIVPRALSIVGPYPQLGNNVANTVLMHDDGKDGDEKAGDGVWSFSAAFPAGAHVTYVYTNSGAPGRWEGLDLPTIRHAMVPSSRERVYLPVETFGRLYMQGDNWHTNAAGYDLIARAVAEAIR